MTATSKQADLYDFTDRLFRLWTKAEGLYRNNKRNPDEYFDDEETKVLAELGLGVMDIYDYVEDFVSSNEPDFGSFIMISAERILYYNEVQDRTLSAVKIREEDLPPKKESVNGIEWLPRIILKAKGKLRGELPAEIMYGCGGDRRFLRGYGIHPAQFLRHVREASADEEIVAWVSGLAQQ